MIGIAQAPGSGATDKGLLASLMIGNALNDATRFISPTKSPERLAAGLSLLSTSIADVVEPTAAWGWSRPPRPQTRW